MKKLVLLTASLLIGAVMAEGLLRIIPSAMRTRIERDRYVRERHVLQDEFGEADSNPALGYHMKPSTEGVFENKEFRARVRFNTMGLRGPEVTGKRSARRFLILGDSITVGWGVEEEETFSAHLGREHATWDVINAGVSGYGTASEAALLKTLGDKLAPTDVLLVFYPNDPIESSHLPRLSAQPKNTRGAPELYLKEALTLAVTKARGQELPYPYYFGTNADMWEKSQTALLEIQKWGKAHQARVWMVYMPLKDELGEEMPVGYRKKFLDYCRAAETPCLDLTPALQQAARSTPLFFTVDEHLTPAGHRLVARALSAWIEKAERQIP